MGLKHYAEMAAQYLSDPAFRMDINTILGKYDSVPDEEFIRMRFRAAFGREPELSHPKTFNEKLQWIKLHDRKPLYTTLVDKYAVKQYIADTLGPDLVVPTIAHWDKPDEITFGSLPEQFVLKCNHDSGGLVICKNKSDLDEKQTIAFLNKRYQRSSYLPSREWPYKDVKKCILAEKYLEDPDHDLRDYKLFCFNGKVKCFKIDFDRFTGHHANYYDLDGNILKIGEAGLPPVFDRKLEIPDTLPQMVRDAEILAKDTYFVRIDFYSVRGHVYFGEVTFFPSGGFRKFIYEGNDELWGSWISLPTDQ